MLCPSKRHKCLLNSFWRYNAPLQCVFHFNPFHFFSVYINITVMSSTIFFISTMSMNSNCQYQQQSYLAETSNSAGWYLDEIKKKFEETFTKPFYQQNNTLSILQTIQLMTFTWQFSNSVVLLKKVLKKSIIEKIYMKINTNALF